MPFTGTRGIVSGQTDQFVNDLLQIDATVDHGNSGGPVLSLRDGHVVGIATAMAGGGKADHLNFATPMKDVCKILSLLRQGIPAEPPQLEISLLVDEDGRHTLTVGCTHDAARWPLRPGDRIVAVGAPAESVGTMSELVTALRGVPGPVRVRVERDGRRVDLKVTPIRRPSVIARRGVVLDGAVIAPIVFEDGRELTEPAQLVVQSVAPGSAAETLGLERMDIIHSVDGRPIDDLDALIARLGRHRAGTPIRVVFRRMSGAYDRWFELHLRDLPGDQISLLGAAPRLLTGSP